MSGEISYNTHILIGVRPNGVMTAIADWPHLPKQADVQHEIDGAHNDYVTLVLCTPTSIVPAGGNGYGATKHHPADLTAVPEFGVAFW